MAFWKRKTEEQKPPQFVEPDHGSPEAFIRSFCQDYKIWNDFCMVAKAEGNSAKGPKLMSRLQGIYEEFVARYVVPNIVPQLISFGTDASFDPERLRFGNLEEVGDRLTQEFSIKSTIFDGSDDYIAHIHRSEDHRLQLQQIYYIDPFQNEVLDDEERLLPCL